MAKRSLGCCVCGSYAGRWEQHWNRDNGFGVCVPCVEWVSDRYRKKGWTEEEIAAEIADLYGKEGVNWGKEGSKA